MSSTSQRRCQDHQCGQGAEAGQGDAQQIEQAIQTLPDYYKEVIILKIWGELTFEQIADTLDIPMNTAASRYRYALEKLRRTLTPAKLAS